MDVRDLQRQRLHATIEWARKIRTTPAAAALFAAAQDAVVLIDASAAYR